MSSTASVAASIAVPTLLGVVTARIPFPISHRPLTHGAREAHEAIKRLGQQTPSIGDTACCTRAGKVWKVAYTMENFFAL